MTDVLWTPKEVAAYFRLSPKNGSNTVLRWYRKGLIKGIRLGDLTRFKKQDIENCINLNQGARGH